MSSSGSVVLASTASDAASRLLGSLEAVAVFVAALLVIIFVAGRATGRLQKPIALVVCLVPAVLLLIIGLVGPAITTIVLSFKNQQFPGEKNTKFVGLDNYKQAFTDSYTQSTLLHTVLWLLIVPAVSVFVGLVVALLIDRMKHTLLVRTLIFLPTAISFVGASVIWSYVYNYRAPGQPQTGLLSEIVMKLGWHNPPNWLLDSPLNTYLLMIILIWTQAGFAMVVLLAALKAIPEEIIEAARMDGADGITLYRTVQIPMIRTTIIVVGTTIMITTLKLYDILASTTNGNFDTDVLARQMFGDFFVTFQVSRGSALAVILFLCVVPLVIYNVRQLRKERAR